MVKKGGMQLNGADVLLKEMKAFGPTVAKQASDTGVRKGASFLRRRMRAEAPYISGRLRNSIKMKYSRKSGRAWVGLRTNFFYKSLEFTTKARGGGTRDALHPFMQKVFDDNAPEVADLIVRETRRALYTQAGKVLAKTKMTRR